MVRENCFLICDLWKVWELFILRLEWLLADLFAMHFDRFKALLLFLKGALSQGFCRFFGLKNLKFVDRNQTTALNIDFF